MLTAAGTRNSLAELALPNSPSAPSNANLTRSAESLVPSGFPLPASDSSSNDRFDSASNVEVANDFHSSRLRACAEIIENSIYRALVENPVVPKAPQIELETFQLDAHIARHIRDDDRAEIRRTAFEQRELTRITLDSTERTERRELRTRHVNLVVASRIWIRECLEQFWLWHPRRMHGLHARGKLMS